MSGEAALETGKKFRNEMIRGYKITYEQAVRGLFTAGTSVTSASAEASKKMTVLDKQ